MARPLALVPVLALILGGVACSSDVPEPAVSQSPTPAAVESPTSTEPAPEPESPEPSPSETAAAFQGPDVNLTDEQQEAVDTVEEFFHYYDRALQEPQLDIQNLASLMEAELSRAVNEVIGTSSSRGWKQIGAAAYQVTSVGAAQEIAGERWLLIQACADLEDIVTIDATTRSIVSEPDSRFLEYELALRSDGSRWVIPEATSEWAIQCDI